MREIPPEKNQDLKMEKQNLQDPKLNHQNPLTNHKSQNLKNELEEEKEYIENIQKIRDYSSEQFEKQLVYLAGGGLIFTVGFVKNIVEITDETNTVLLVMSWICFASTLILNLFSHRTAIKAMDKEVSGRVISSYWWNRTTVFLNTISIGTLVLAILLFTIFISKNI